MFILYILWSACELDCDRETSTLQKGARKKPNEIKKADGAFGKKKKKSTTFSSTKKRKTTKRDGFKVYDAAKPKDDNKNKKASNKKRGKRR